jgi:lipase chaperone LimK
MNGKRLLTLAAVVAFAAMAVFIMRGKDEHDAYVISGENDVSEEEWRNYFKAMDIEGPGLDRYFADSIANPQTVRFFKALQGKFKNLDFESHLEAIHAYLRRMMSAERAEEMFALYKKFATYEKSLIADSKRFRGPVSGRDALSYLRDIQRYRREFFGAETADRLFGLEVRTQEYLLRKGLVLNENSYGAEKEKKLAALQRDIWGGKGSPLDEGRQPLERYNEKLQIFARDLGELSDEERAERVRSFRSEFFSEDVVRRLEKVDAEIATDVARERVYRTREHEIKSDSGLSDDEKTRILESLQREIFGDDAESFKRREAIANGSGR